MAITYTRAPDVEETVRFLARHLDMPHVDARVICVRSTGSKSRWTLARCHAMSRVFEAALETPMHYVIEVIAETYDKLSDEEKTRTLIHEMLHIPKAFGGGLKSHRFVNSARVNRLYRQLKRLEVQSACSKRVTRGRAAE